MTGRKINPLAVRPEDIDIVEMAHGLALLNRFYGATPEPLNVAQHSVFVSRLCGTGRAALQGLLHDGPEYILGEVTHWLKKTAEFDGYRLAEDRLQRLIFEKYGCPPELLPEVKAADTLMARIEGEYAWGPNWSDVPGYEPLSCSQYEWLGWAPWDWQTSERAFIERFKEVR